MAFDSLKRNVEDYKENKGTYDTELSDFNTELEKANEMAPFTNLLDSEITVSLDQMMNEFSSGQQEFEVRGNALEQTKNRIGNEIASEQQKLEQVSKQLEALKGKAYADRMKNVSDKTEDMNSMLDSMAEQIGIDTPKKSAGGVGSLFQKFFGKQTDSTPMDAKPVKQGPMFGSFPMTQLQGRTDYFVHGANYDKFISNYYQSERSTYVDLGQNAIIKTVSPDLIEGIHLGQREAEEENIFWSQHKSDGTRASFVAIASHIGEVNDLLQAGYSLDDIKKRPDLESCVTIYFKEDNMPHVVDNGDYYEFDTNGRHRILAAREAGYDIPVKIIATRRWQ